MKRLLISLSCLCLTLLVCSPSAVRAQWGPEVRLSDPSDTTVKETSYTNAWCVAANGNTVNAVWYAYNADRTSYEIWTCRSTDGGATWGSPVQRTNTGGAGYPSIARAGNVFHIVGNLYVSSGVYDLYYMRSTDGGATWSSGHTITATGGEAWYPSVAVTGNIVHVVWMDNPNLTLFNIYYIRSTDNGTTWGPVVKLSNSNSNGGATTPSVAVAGNNVHVAWLDSRAYYYLQIYYNRSTDGGATWVGETPLTNNPNDTTGTMPSVAAADSLVHLVWATKRDGNCEIYYKRSTDNGATFAETRLTNDPAASYFPSVTASGSMVHVVWLDNRNGPFQIYYKRSTDRGTTWSPDTGLTRNTGNVVSFYPSVAADGSMVHVVFWYYGGYPGYQTDIYYIHNLTGNSGVETAGIRDQGSGIMVVARPNPFATFASVPGHEGERFALYDVSGRMVGTYRGDRIGEGLAPGVYFLRPEEPGAKPVRVVKLR